MVQHELLLHLLREIRLLFNNCAQWKPNALAQSIPYLQGKLDALHSFLSSVISASTTDKIITSASSSFTNSRTWSTYLFPFTAEFSSTLQTYNTGFGNQLKTFHQNFLVIFLRVIVLADFCL
jgi:hypothetical protein